VEDGSGREGLSDADGVGLAEEVVLDEVADLEVDVLVEEVTA
jgi:hypothetical protein